MGKEDTESMSFKESKDWANAVGDVAARSATDSRNHIRNTYHETAEAAAEVFKVAVAGMDPEDPCYVNPDRMMEWWRRGREISARAKKISD